MVKRYIVDQEDPDEQKDPADKIYPSGAADPTEPDDLADQGIYQNREPDDLIDQ